jgi:hypothetical protein
MRRMGTFLDALHPPVYQLLLLQYQKTAAQSWRPAPNVRQIDSSLLGLRLSDEESCLTFTTLQMVVEILIVEGWKGSYSVMPGEIAPPSNPFIIAMKVRLNQREKDALYPRSCR